MPIRMFRSKLVRRLIRLLVVVSDMEGVSGWTQKWLRGCRNTDKGVYFKAAMHFGSPKEATFASLATDRADSS